MFPGGFDNTFSQPKLMQIYSVGFFFLMGGNGFGCVEVAMVKLQE